MEVRGIKSIKFVSKEGNDISGNSLYLSYPLDPANGGQGEGFEKVFLSSAKMAALPFKPSIGDEVELFYNRFGKVETIRAIDVALDI